MRVIFWITSPFVGNAGKEITAKVDAVNPLRYTFVIPELAEGEIIHISAAFKENGHNLKINLNNGGTSTVKVLGADNSGLTTAKMNDRIFVQILEAAGKKKTKLYYTYQINNRTETKDIVTVDDPVKNVYVFYMPDADVTIYVVFADDAASPGTNPNAAVTAAGMSVGVGASFGFTYSNMDVEAGVGANRRVTAGAMDIRAKAIHYADTITVAGTDPLGTAGSYDSGAVKKIALDASAAVHYLKQAVRAYVEKGAYITTTGGETINISDDENLPVYVNFNMIAEQKGKTLTQASGFAMGSATAVGAAVTVNIANSDVRSEFLGTGDMSGSVNLLAKTHDEDDSKALATAMGADMKRYIDKFQSGAQSTEDAANKVADGSAFTETPPSGNNEGNKTAGTVNQGLDQNSNSEHNNIPEKSNNNLPLSQNALRSQDVNTESPDKTDAVTGEAKKEANANTDTSKTDGKDVKTNPTIPGLTSIQIAAAVSLNITNHLARAIVTGTMKAREFKIQAINEGNFQTLGTGLAVSGAINSNAIAAGIAVSVNKNQAKVLLDGSLIARGENNGKNDGTITASSSLTQNMDGKYKGYLGSQALAGSATGAGSKVSVAGAVSIIVSKAETETRLADETHMEGGVITLEAYDKSKLAVRAGGMSISKGAAVGVGASFALIYAHNKVLVIVGDENEIIGTTLKITAKKSQVDFSDYETALGLDTLVTDTTGLTTEQEAAVKKGLINIKKGTGNTDGYTVTINASSDKVMDLINLMNFLSSTNYYAESIAGAVSGGTATASVGGSVAMVFFYNETRASIGKNTKITLTEDMQLIAEADTTARIIAGALSASTAQTGVGVTIGFIYNEDLILTEIGEGSILRMDGSYTQRSDGSLDMLVITAAAAVTTQGTGVGGAINAIGQQTKARATINAEVVMEAGGHVTIAATLDSMLLTIAVSASGSGATAAVGGTVAVIVTSGEAGAQVADHVIIISRMGNVQIGAENHEKLISVCASASASSGTGVAGTLNVLIPRSGAYAIVGDYTSITAGKGIKISSAGNTKLIVISMAFSGAGTNAIGATIFVNVFRRNIQTIIGEYVTMKAGAGSIVISAMSKEWNLMITLSAAGSGSNAVGGTLPVIVGSSQVTARVGDHGTYTSCDSIGVLADLESNIYMIAGGMAGSGAIGVGATASTVVLKNQVSAQIGDYVQLLAYAVIPSSGIGGIAVSNRTDRRSGVIVSALAREYMVLASIGAGAAGTTAVGGAVNTLIIENHTRASIGQYSQIQSGRESETQSHKTKGNLIVEADDDSHVIDLAGALGAAGSVGVGATVVVLVFQKKTESFVGNEGIIHVTGDIAITADSRDHLYLFAAAVGAAGTVGVAGGVNTLVFENETTAYVGGTMNADGSIRIEAENRSTLINAALAVAGSGTVAVSAVIVVTYFYNKTIAYATAKAKLQAMGDLIIRAASTEIVSADAAGISGSGLAGVGGTMDIIITKVITRAYTMDHVTLISTRGNIQVTAEDSYDLIAVVVTIAGAGKVGVGVTALVNVAVNQVNAAIGTNNTIQAGKNILVSASSNRDIDAYAATLGGAGIAGVAVSVVVVVSGSKMSQDAHDSLYQKEVGDENSGYTESGINPQTNVDASFRLGNQKFLQDSNYQPKDSLDDLLAGDGQHAKDTTDHLGGENVGADSFGQKLDSKETGTQGQKETVTDSSNMNETLYDTVTEQNKKNRAPLTVKNESGETLILTDATSAVIHSGTTLSAGADIQILAEDVVNLSMLAGAVAGAGGTGVGTGVSVATLASNAEAAALAGTRLIAGGTILIHASTGASEKEVGGEDTTIRIIATVGSGGMVGVGVSVAVLIVHANVRAILAGDVLTAKNLSVLGTMNYDKVIAVTISAGGGYVAVNVSAATVYFQGTVETAILGNARISEVEKQITLRTDGATTAAVSASAAGGGAVSAAVSLAFAMNRTTIWTYIGQGVQIDKKTGIALGSAAAVKVETTFTADAKALMISASIGGVGMGVTVVVVINQATALTYIGKTPYEKELAAGSTGNQIGRIQASKVVVQNHLRGATEVLDVGVAGGLVAVNGAVALGFNRMIGYAAIHQMNVETTELFIQAMMNGDVIVTTTSLVAGAVGVGAAVALAHLKTQNVAQLDVTGVVVYADKVQVIAGRQVISGGVTTMEPYASKAMVSVIYGAAAKEAAAALNFGIAINRAVNKSIVQGNKENGAGELTASDLQIIANGITRAYAVIAGANISKSGLAANVSFGFASLSSVQEALLTGNASYRIGSLRVISNQNMAEGTQGSYQLTFDEKDANGINQAKENHRVGSRNFTFQGMAEAYILAANFGVMAASANSATALTDAIGRAKIATSDLVLTGNIQVISNGKSLANASVSNLTATLASVGLIITYAYAKGTFEAIIDTGGTITSSGNIQIQTTYEAKAEANTVPALGGIAVSLLSIRGNGAYAEVLTKSTAAIRGNGKLYADGNITVKNTGMVHAKAMIEGAHITLTGGASIALNYAEALLHAQQRAAVEARDVQAGSLTVQSLYNYTGENKDKVPDINEHGAYAIVGSNLGQVSIEVSQYSMKANTAIATSNSQVEAFVKPTNMKITGKLEVITKATSYAEAILQSPALAGGYVNGALNLLDAYARGIYQSWISGNGGTIAAGSIQTATYYNTRAYALTGPAGDVSGSVSGVSLTVNMGEAHAETIASSYVGARREYRPEDEHFGKYTETVSTGTIRTDKGNLEVMTRGSASANTTVLHPTISVSIVKMSASIIRSKVNVQQSAALRSSGNIEASGNILVESIYYDNSVEKGEQGGAVAEITSAGGKKGIDIALIGLGINEVYAESTLHNQAMITGTLVQGNHITVQAEAMTSARASAKNNFSAGFVSLGGLYARAVAKDKVLVTIGKSTKLTALGALTLRADNKTYVTSSSQSPGSVNLVNGEAGYVTAEIGEWSEKNKNGDTNKPTHNQKNAQTVVISVEDGAEMIAGGQVQILANNYGEAKAIMEKGVSVSGITLSISLLPTYSDYLTKILLGTGSKMTSKTGDIQIILTNIPVAQTHVTGTSVGILISADKKYAQNILVQEAAVTVGRDVIMDAHGGIRIQSSLSAEMTAETNADSGGIFAGGAIKARNTLTRTNRVTIGNGAKLTADYDKIEIRAISGSQDHIRTSVTGNSAGLITISGADARTSIQSTTVILVGLGAVIQNIFNTILIKAEVGEGSVITIGDYGSTALSSNPNVRSYASDITSNGEVRVGEDDGLGSNSAKYGQTLINGKNVELMTGIPSLYVYNYTKAITKGAHGTAHATSDINIKMNLRVMVKDAHLKAYDKLYIVSNAIPENTGSNLVAEAGTKIVAFIGSLVSNAIIRGKIESDVQIGKEGQAARLTGADITIQSIRFSGTVIVKAYGRRKAIASKSINASTKGLALTKPLNIGNNVWFHVGDGAAGIVIDIQKDGMIRSVGMPNEQVINRIANGNIQILGTIGNSIAGRLNVQGTISSASRIYGQEYIQEVTIWNHSDLHLILNMIDVYNEGYLRPVVNAANTNYNKSWLAKSPVETPLIQILSFHGTDVTFGGVIGTETKASTTINETGSVRIKWMNPDLPGGLYTNHKATIGGVITAPIWTHELIVENAREIGKRGENIRFMAYLAPYQGQDALVRMNAAENIYAELTLTKIMKTSGATVPAPPNQPITESLSLEHIAAGTSNDILLPYAMALNYDTTQKHLSVVIPGVVSFTSDTVDFGTDFVLSVSDLTRYLVGSGGSEEYRVYSLPNGYQIYLDKNDRVLRILNEEGSSVFDADQYGTIENDNWTIVFTEEGVRFDYRTGRITVDADKKQDYGFYLEYKDGKWTDTRVVEREVYEITLKYSGEYSGVDENTLVTWKTVSNQTYYFLFPYLDEKKLEEIKNEGIYQGSMTDLPAVYLYYYRERLRSTDYYVVVIDNIAKRALRVFKTTHETAYAPGLGGLQTSQSATNLVSSTPIGGGMSLQLYRGTRTTVRNVSQSGYKLIITYTQSAERGVIIDGNGAELGSSWKYEKPGDPVLKIELGGVTYTFAKVSGWYYPTGEIYGVLLGMKYKIGCDLNSDNTIATMNYERGYLEEGARAELKEREGESTIVIINDAGEEVEQNVKYKYWSYRVSQDGSEYDVIVSKIPVFVDPSNHIDTTVEVIYDEKDPTKILYGIVYLSPGESMILPLADGRYQITDDLAIKTDGTIVKSGSDGYTYQPFTGDVNTRKIMAAYQNQQLQSLVLKKQSVSVGPLVISRLLLHLEQITDTLARDALGNYYYKDLNHNPNAEWKKVTIDANGSVVVDGSKKMDVYTVGDVEYYKLYEERVIVGSDGSVVWMDVDTEKEVVKSTVITGETNYRIGLLEAGENLTIKVEGRKSSLLDGNDTPQQKAMNLKAGNDITIFSRSDGSIGTEENPLEMSAGGQIILKDLNDRYIISTDTYIHVESGDFHFHEDTEVNGNIVDGTGTRGVILQVITDAGDINSERLTILNDSRVLFDAAGTIRGNEWNTADSQMTIKTSEDMAVNQWNVADSDATMRVSGDLLIGQWHLTNSQVLAEAGGDIGFDRILAKKSRLRMAAGENMREFTAGLQNAVIYDADDKKEDALLQVSAGWDIGSQDVWLQVDIPAALTMYIEQVQNYYIHVTETSQAASDSKTGLDREDKEQT